jgi:acetyl-CoA synthetase
MKQVGVSTWDELYEFSIRDVERFTEEVLKFLDIKFDPPYERLMDISEGIEFPRWFARGDARHKSEPGAVATGSPAGLNITTMCLDRWQTDATKGGPAVIWEGEDEATETLTYAELLSNVERCVAGLRTNGLGEGDAVGIHLPMLPETVIALLAINRIGGIAVPIFSGYGVEAIVSRMNAVEAKALFTTFGFSRRGKTVQSHGFEAAGKCASVRTLFVISSKVSAPPRRPTREERIERSRARFEAYSAMSEEEKRVYQQKRDAERKRQIEEFYAKMNFSAEEIAEFEQQTEKGEASVGFGIRDVRLTPIEHPSEVVMWDALMNIEPARDVAPSSAEDPLIILYTSGTTGKPKGIAHTHASFPIKAAQDMAFGTDVGRGTRICWYTDIGWMMGPWLIYGALINGATICIYDGAPDYPTPDRMWEFCAKHKVEILGISPTLVRALAAHEEASATGERASRLQTPLAVLSGGKAADASETLALQSPYQRHDLSSLRAFASTGEPWNPAPWWWLFEKVGNSKLPIINYSGGTEIAGGILMGNPLLPIKPCSFPAPCPGMDVDILDENGKSVGPNQVGELVIKQPWIGMARGFWEERERYLDTYWRRFKNIWVHGDWAMRDKDAHWFILGRSDDTLKVAGKRVGPAEVESLLVAHPLVTEAAVIGVPDEKKGTAMVAFCVLASVPSVSSVVNEDGTTENTESTEQLGIELRSLVARDMGKPLAPSKIHFVSALPKTRNAKVMRRVIRAAYLGEDAGDLSALENPNAVDEIKSLSHS